jgi:hypothetical protein
MGNDFGKQFLELWDFLLSKGRVGMGALTMAVEVEQQATETEGAEALCDGQGIFFASAVTVQNDQGELRRCQFAIVPPGQLFPEKTSFRGETLARLAKKVGRTVGCMMFAEFDTMPSGIPKNFEVVIRERSPGWRGQAITPDLNEGKQDDCGNEER